MKNSRRRFLKSAGLLAAAPLVRTVFAAQGAEPRPNVILIMVDDLGYNDLSCYGSTKMKTPVLDRMAQEGIRLSSFYAGAAVCTPSRMALLTGAYPSRVGWKGGVLGYGMKSYHGLAPEALTIAEVFKGAGYQTALYGKWHLGKGEMLPMNQGFDEAYYIRMSNNQTDKLWRGNELIADPFDNRRLTENFTNEAIEFINSLTRSTRSGQEHAPFFLYIPYTAPHFPAEAHPDWEGKSDNGAYGDVVEEMDSRIGQILDALEENKLDRNTIVVFTSDNGPEGNQKKWSSAAPYRGRKWSSLEGGTRVPCIVRWPGAIPPGRETDALTAAIDLLPTLAHACGIDMGKVSQGKPRQDGVNVWDSLLGRETNHPRKDLLYWHGQGEAKAIREGDWKLYFDRDKDVPGSNKGPALFHLPDDPGERKNLSDAHPEKVKHLLALARKRLNDIHEHSMPLGGSKKEEGKMKDHKTKKWGEWLK